MTFKDEYQYILSDIRKRKGGGYVLVAEQLTHELKKKTVGREVTYENHYQHHALLVVDVAEGGSINWLQKIPKKQYAEELSVFYTSYALLEKDDKLYFIYNDISKKDLNIAHWVKRSKVNMAELDKEGKLRQAELFTSEEAGINYRPTEFRQTGDGDLLMYGQKKLKSGYVKVRVN